MIPRRSLCAHLLFAFLLFALSLVFVNLISAQKDSSSSAQGSGDLRVLTLTTPRGDVKVSLPDDIRPGDTISGTVTTEPKGKDPTERKDNDGRLMRDALKIDTQRWQVSDGRIQLTIPESATGPEITLVDEKDRKLAQAVLALMRLAELLAKSRNPGLPPLGQTGRPYTISGVFDGNSANTSVMIGGTPARVIAESPRQVIVESPRDVVGQTNIEVKDNGTATTGSFRNLKIDLTAPKTSLLKGESTELHMQVNGLEGLTKPVQVQLQNQSPSNINISGGNTQNIVVQPSQVKLDGTFPWTTNVTGTGNGPFIITARVTPDMFFPPSSPSTSTPSPTSSPTPVVPAQTKAKQLDAIVTPSLAQCSPPSGLLDPGSIIPTSDAREFPRDRIAKTLHGMWRGQVIGSPLDNEKGGKPKEGNVDYFWIFDTLRNEGLIIALRNGNNSMAGLKPVANAPKITYLLCPGDGSLPTTEKGSEIHEFVKVSDSIDDAPRVLAKATGLKSGTGRLTLADLWKGILASGYFKSLPSVTFAGALFKPIRLELVPSPIGPAQVSLSWDSEYYGGGTTSLKSNPGAPINGVEYTQFIGTTTTSGDFLVSSPGNGKLHRVETVSGGKHDLALHSVVLGPLQ